jgi:deazaflavin-dependent oxidoreductase (nitroreductase family)
MRVSIGAIQRFDISQNVPPRLPVKDRLNQWLEHGLDWRLRGPGIKLYRLTNGGISRLSKVDLLLLTTRGRRTGKQRTVVLPFFRDGASVVVVAANAGLPSNPDWFHNLQADPNALIDIGNESRRRAQTWNTMYHAVACLKPQPRRLHPLAPGEQRGLRVRPQVKHRSGGRPGEHTLIRAVHTH